MVDGVAAEKSLQHFFAVGRRFFVGSEHGLVARVDQDLLAGLGVLERDDAGRRNRVSTGTPSAWASRSASTVEGM